MNTNNELLQAIGQMMDTKLAAALEPINTRLDKVDSRFDNVDSRLDTIQADLTEIKEELDDMHKGINAMVDWIEDIDNRKQDAV